MVAMAKETKDSLYDRLYGSIILPSNIVEFYPDPTLVIDAEGKVAAWNRAMEVMTGFPAENMIGKGNYEYALPFYGERIPMLVDMVDWPEEKIKDLYTGVSYQGNKLEAMTIRARLKGRYVVLWGTASKLLGMDGKPIGTIECIRDVTVQNTLEEKLRRQNKKLQKWNKRLKSQKTELSRVYDQLKMSEEKYRLITASTSDGLVAVDLTGVITYVNPMVLEMVGLEPDNIIGRHFTDFISGEYVEMVKEAFIKGLEGNNISPLEIEGVNGKGERIPLEISGGALNSARGEKQGAIVNLRDVSDRKKARETLIKAHDELERRVEERTAELTKARSLLQTVLDTIPAGIIVADSETGQVVYSNQGAARVFGPHILGHDYYTGSKSYTLLLPDGTPIKRVYNPMNRSLSYGGYVYDEELLVRHRDGPDISALISSAPVLDNGHIVGAVASVIDITERKIMERSLEEAKERAELYLDLMGHDINNMNQVAMGYLELARSLTSGDSEAAKYMDGSLAMLDAGSRLIVNVMKIQQAVGGSLKLETVDLDTIIKKVKAEFSIVSGREVTIRYRPVKGCTVMANQLLQDVFSNIVGNAIKHSTGPLHIAIIIRRRRKGHSTFYEISIEDDGPGIPDELKNAVFCRMKRGPTKAKGSGLGLFLVKTMVEGFGGEARVEDRVEGDSKKGCRFIVTLPAA
jgi:PAS domain S-box-containing protein